MIDAKLVPGGLSVEISFAKFYPPLIEVIKRIPQARFNPVTKKWKLPLRSFLPFYDQVADEYLVKMPPGLRRLKASREPEVEPVFSYPLIDTVGLLNDGYTFMPHQHEALSQAVYYWKHSHTGILCAIPVGGGKTLVGIGFQKVVKYPALLVCPVSIKTQWAREIETFAGGTSLIIHGSPAKRKKLWAEATANPDKYDFIICNYQQVVSDYKMMPPRRLTIIDEAHRYKNPGSKMSKAMLNYKRYKSDLFLELTGTFLINQKYDAWNLMRLAGYSFESSFSSFKTRYCHMDEYGNVIGVNKQIKPFMEALARVTYYRSKTQLMKSLPPRNEVMHYIQLDGPQRRFYDDLAQGELEVFAGLDREPTQLELENVWCHLRQAAAVPSCVKKTDPEGNPIEVKYPEDSAKLDWMRDFLDDFDDDFMIVYSPFTSFLDAIQERFPDEPWVRIDGSVEGHKRQPMIDKARESGKAYFLITDAMGTGVNLQFCNQLVFFSLPLTDADREQIEGRVWRTGQQRQSNIHYVLTLDTVDISIYNMLKAKRDLMRGFAGINITFMRAAATGVAA